MIEFTKEQQEAIDYFDSNLLLSASAGSGKTRVLLEKVVKLIESGVSLDAILMVTFTNLAASEMKSKLENMLLEKENENNSNIIFDALNKINICDISTLHSFCQKLVREYYYILNIEPTFEIKDETYISFLKNKAINETIKFYLDNSDNEFKDISNLFIQKRDYTLFKEEILNFYEFLSSKPNKYAFIENLIKQTYNIDINKNELISKFVDFYKQKINSFMSSLYDIKLKANQIKSEKLSDLCNVFINHLNDKSENNLDFIKYFKNEVKFPQIRISSKAQFEEISLKEELQQTAKDVKVVLSFLNDLFNFENLDELKNNLKQSEKILLKLILIVKTFEERFKTLKAKNNCLDFNDLEGLTLKLLENKEIRNIISKKYKYIFVDEYQDTNSIQEEILKNLSISAKLIMVGDLKQSIYAFRECNPKIFNDKLIKYLKKEDGYAINLNMNFRSNKTILDFSNNIFSNIMRKENCDYSYKDIGKFVCGLNLKTFEENTLKPVEVLCLDKNSEIIKDDEDNQKENILILNSIYNLLNQKIEENGTTRNLTFKDIAIISRKRGDKIKKLCKFLDENKIPYSCKYSESLFKSFEVKLILAYLNILNNFENEISLYSVLKNIYNFTTNELLKIKKSNLYEDLKEYSQEDEIKRKIDLFLADYNYLKQESSEINVKELIKLIINKTNLDLILMKDNGKRASEIIKVFLNNVSDNFYNLNEFLTFCKEIEDKKFEIQEVKSDNCITIDTFHSTKGLEYNAVIIINGGDSIFARNSSNLIYNAKLGVGIFDFNEKSKTKKASFMYEIVSKLNKQEEFNEEVRVGYVAFTRAKNFMIVIGKEKINNLNKENNPINFLDFASYMSLIFSVENCDKNISINVLNGEENIFNPMKENVLKDEKMIDVDFSKFKNIKDKKYKHKNSLLLQLKNSVTSIMEEDKFIYNISNFKISDNDQEDYIELGNSYHKVLEKLPFSLRTQKEVRNKVLELIENKEINNNIYEYIEDNKVLNAIKSVGKLIDEKDKIFKEQIFMMYVPHKEITSSNLEDKVLIQGIIDLYIEKENEIILVDYKTSRLNDVNVIKKYTTQLNLYALALSEKYRNKKISKYIYSIFLDKLINIV